MNPYNELLLGSRIPFAVDRVRGYDVEITAGKVGALAAARTPFDVHLSLHDIHTAGVFTMVMPAGDCVWLIACFSDRGVLVNVGLLAG